MRFCESVSLLAFGIARYIALFFLNNFIYLFWFGWVFMTAPASLQLQWAGVTLRCSLGASPCSDFFLWSRGYRMCGLRELGLGVQRLWLRGSSTQAQWLWSLALVAPVHVGSSWPNDWTQASCINSQILYHWATREAWCVAFILRKRRMFVKQTKNRNKTSLPSFPPNSRKDSGHRCWYIKLFLPQLLFKIF